MTITLAILDRFLKIIFVSVNGSVHPLPKGTDRSTDLHDVDSPSSADVQLASWRGQHGGDCSGEDRTRRGSDGEARGRHGEAINGDGLASDGSSVRRCVLSYIRFAIILSSYTINKCSAVTEMGDRLATIDMGRKLRGCAPLGQLGPLLTQCGLRRGLPSYQVAS